MRSSYLNTEMKQFLCTWLGEVCYSCSLTVLPDPAWVVLNNDLQRIVFTSVLNKVKRTLKMAVGADAEICLHLEWKEGHPKA